MKIVDRGAYRVVTGNLDVTKISLSPSNRFSLFFFHRFSIILQSSSSPRFWGLFDNFPGGGNFLILVSETGSSFEKLEDETEVQ